MGRFLSGGTGPRTQRVQLLASNPSVPVPSWAKAVRVTGCGGGMSGSMVGTSGQRGNGGAAGGFANGLLLPIPSGVTTLAAVIGAGGSPVTMSTTTPVNGNNGGNTTLTIGTNQLTLEGGGVPGGGFGGRAYMGAPSLLVGVGVNNGNPPFDGPTVGATNLGQGSGTPQGSNASSGFGQGAHSQFGSPGPALTVGPTTDSPGVSATGFGAGGSGGLRLTGTVSSGAGAPGFLDLEFLEAV